MALLLSISRSLFAMLMVFGKVLNSTSVPGHSILLQRSKILFLVAFTLVVASLVFENFLNL